MSKKLQAEHMGKLYREFSRQKYSKYKHQFPKMRESEIVSKIIHQWDAMDLQAKLKLQEMYENNKFLIKEEPGDYSSAKKALQSARSVKSQIVRSEQKQTTEKVTPQKEDEKENEKSVFVSKFEPNQNNSNVESSLVSTPKKENKKISKLGRRDYLTFFKHYFQEFRRQHPKWNQKQISYTIGLLWKKRKLQYKVTTPKKKAVSAKTLTKVTGRRLFKMQKKLKSSQVNMKWKQLPLEAKKIWSNPTMKMHIGSDKIVGKMCLKSSGEISANPLSFLSKQMQ